MMCNQLNRIITCLCITAVLAGCSQNKSMDMSAMKPPERPRQLDMLEGWVGNWRATGEMHMPDGKVAKMSGTSTIAWECDKTAMVEKMTHEMEGMGKMTGLAVYTWNADDKCYGTYFFSSMGEANSGTMKYDEQKKCFIMSGKGKNPMTGEMTKYVGEMRLPDSSTMEWKWEEWDSWGMKKTCYGSGVAKRQ